MGIDEKLLKDITKRLTDEGKIIEAGWEGLKLCGGMSPNATQAQLEEHRMTFFAGASHLFASIMAMLDSGTTDTPGDLSRITKIHIELQKFEREFQSRLMKARGKK